ncbi:MAG: hypothetical protein JST16_15260 [Bdellovibrionales bacterium]|nr:hypothetical protein [Bdellovibrionales bacterium]
MRVVTVDVAVLQNCTQLGLVVVQMRSPFKTTPPEMDLKSSREASWLEWANGAVARRTAQISSLLNELKANRLVGKDYPTVLIFPEYTVPKPALQGIQDYADTNRTIIVAGTYYEEDETDPLYRNNVCTIFLPGQEDIRMVKRNGFDREQAALSVSPTVPNVVHLGGNNSKLGNFSLSTFICRDFLVPYEISEGGRRTLIVDSARPGFNLVTMCSPQTTLFESLSAFDLRELRGRRRLTVLCNCSGMTLEGPVQTGSAILGPREDVKAFDGDVIRRLRSNDDGVIVADISLNSEDLAIVERRPAGGTPRFLPVLSASTYNISSLPTDPSKEQLRLRPIAGSSIATRGVWHPAFLELQNLKIVMQLFRTKDLVEVRNAINNSGIKSVSAYVIEGTSDVLMRYYDSAGAQLHLEDTPYNMMSKDKFNSLFFTDRPEIEILPKDIIKYRTVALGLHPNRNEWDALKQQIEEIIPPKVGDDRRRAIMQCITKLSRDWNDTSVSDQMRTLLSPVFLPEREIIPPTAAHQPGPNNVRQVFMLISMSSKRDVNTEMRTAFEQDVINRLMLMPEVRSIYRIRPLMLGDAVFEFWVDMVAEHWRLQDIILEMDTWGHRLNMTCGTRTMGVLDYLLLESVEGVFATDIASAMHRFHAACKQIASDIFHPIADRVPAAHAFLQVCSQHWQEERYAFQGLDARKLRGYVSEFYVYLFLGHLSLDVATQDECIHHAAQAWESLFKETEAAFQNALTKFYALGPEATKDELLKRSTEHLKSLGVNEDVLKFAHQYPIQKAFILAEYDPSFTLFARANRGREAAYFNTHIRPLRNSIIHGAGEKAALTVYQYPSENADDAEAIATKTGRLIDLLNLAKAYVRAP